MYLRVLLNLSVSQSNLYFFAGLALYSIGPLITLTDISEICSSSVSFSQTRAFSLTSIDPGHPLCVPTYASLVHFLTMQLKPRSLLYSVYIECVNIEQVIWQLTIFLHRS